MNYVEFVKSNDFGGRSKTAMDLAKLLDHKIMQIDTANFSFRNMAVKEERQRVFNAFCYICFKSRVEYLTMDNDLVTNMMDVSLLHLSFKETKMSAKLYTKILIVDDYLDEIVNTLIYGLAGWPNIDIDFLLVDPPCDVQKEEWIENIINQIIFSKANVILMDQGLVNMKGSSIVKKMLLDPLNAHLIFIPNTGGDPYELIEAGACNVNFNKASFSVNIEQFLIFKGQSKRLPFCYKC